MGIHQVGIGASVLQRMAAIVVVTPPTFDLALLKVGAVLSACQVAGAYTWPGGPVTETAWTFTVDGAAVAGSYVILPGDVLVEATISLSATGLPGGTTVQAVPTAVQNTVPHAIAGATRTVDVVPGDGSGDISTPDPMAAPTWSSTCTRLTITKGVDPDDGGSPITGYEYRYSLDAEATWTSPAAISTPALVTGLISGATVHVQTRALNAVDPNPNNWSPSAAATMKVPVLVGQKTFGVATTAGDKVISLTDLTGGIAAAPAAGDFVIMGMASGAVATRAIAETTGTYTNLFSKIYVNLTEDLNFFGAYKVIGPTPDTTMTVTNTQNAVDAGAVGIQVWRYIDPTTPLDAAVVTGQGNDGQPVPGAMTPAHQHAPIIVFGAGAAGNAAAANFTSADLSGFQTLLRNNTHSVTIGMGYHDWTGVSAWQAAQFGGGNNAAGNARASFVAALRPY